MSDAREWIPIILSLMAAGGSSYTWFAGRGKRRADEAGVLTEAAVKLIDKLESRIDAMAQTIEAVEAELEKVERELDTERRLRIALEERVQQLETENGNLRQENYQLRVELDNRKRGL